MCDQDWFWTEEWQEKERKVDEHIFKGEILTFDNIEDFLDSLKKEINDELLVD